MKSGGSFFSARVRWPVMPSLQSLERLVRRWAWALAGAFAGMGLVAVFAWEAYEEHDLWRYKVQALRAAHKAVPAKTAASSPAASDASSLVERLPAQREVSALWLALQQGMAQRGLQVQDLRPQTLLPAQGLSSQAVALRLQGRFVDGVQVWASLVDAGPVWTLDRLTVVPGVQAGQLQWDGIWRAWLRPDAPSAHAWPAHWDLRAREGASGVDPFVTTKAAAPVAGASESLPAELVEDPRRWPLAHIRLLGVWQQGGQWQAVLGAGAYWAVLAPGAPLAIEAYRVQAVRPEGVVLQAATGHGPVHVLRLEGSK